LPISPWWPTLTTTAHCHQGCVFTHLSRIGSRSVSNAKPSSSPAAYPHLLISQQEDLQAEYSDLLQSILGHESLLPSDLSILHGKKSWLLNLDAVILSDTGNIYDVMFMACRAALFDTRVPRTRAVAYQTTTTTTTKMSDDPRDVEMEDNFKAALRSRKQSRAADFELEDTWDEGVPLTEREKWPICITLNVVSPTTTTVLM